MFIGGRKIIFRSIRYHISFATLICRVWRFWVFGSLWRLCICRWEFKYSDFRRRVCSWSRCYLVRWIFYFELGVSSFVPVRWWFFWRRWFLFPLIVSRGFSHPVSFWFLLTIIKVFCIFTILSRRYWKSQLISFFSNRCLSFLRLGFVFILLWLVTI